MRQSPKLSCALLALFGFGACGGESGQDLFTPGTFGIGTVARGGTGNTGRGGAINNVARGGSSSGGVVFVTGGKSSGGALGTGGSLPRGGSSSTGGFISRGGATGTGGRAAGGGSNAVTSGGRVGTGGRIGSGGSSSAGASCSGMRTELSSLLTQAQVCSSSGSTPPCSGLVMNECGCTVPVNSDTSAATQAYLNQLEMIAASCTKPVCSGEPCVQPTSAWCMTPSGAAMGHCLGTTD